MKKDIAAILRGYRILNGLVPGYLPVAAARSVFGALLPFINIIMSAKVIDALTGGETFERVLLLAAITVAANFAVQTIMNAAKRVSAYLSENIWNTYEMPLDEKQRTMDFERIESPDTRLLRQKLHTFRNSTGGGLLPLHWTFEDIIESLFTILFSAGITFSAFLPTGAIPGGAWGFLNQPLFGILFLLLVLGNAALGMFFVSKRTKKTFEILKGFHTPNMHGNYFGDLLMTKYQAGKDAMIYRLRDNVFHVMDGMRTTFHSIVKKWAGNETRYYNYSELCTNLLSALVHIFVAAKAVLGGLGVGSIVQYAGGITRFNTGLSNLVANIARLYANMEPLNLFFEFLDMPDKAYHGTLPVEKRDDHEYELEFHSVSFKYPGSDAYALRDLSMKLRVGQRMAIVGMNGSGKTTMIKLLCRLYDPTEGTITLNGIDIKKYDYAEYMGIFSVVFQDFKLFSFPLGQNVAASMDVDQEKAERCLRMAGLSERLSSMPMGLDTPLYKDFDENGVEISGGEAQKIALARALYKDAPFIVLDEPTAALDPVAEFEVYSKFNEMIGGKTAVFISHRLSSCRFCDDIAVFHEGRLIQRGGHEALLADAGGKYAELWSAQAQYYANEKV